MSEVCADCGEYFGSPSEMIAHVRAAHPGGDPGASRATNPESTTPGLACALCGQRFTSREELARHNIRPHYRSNRPRPLGPYVTG